MVKGSNVYIYSLNRAFELYYVLRPHEMPISIYKALFVIIIIIIDLPPCEFSASYRL